MIVNQLMDLGIAPLATELARRSLPLAGSTRQQLLNYKTQNHFSWLVVIPLGQKKSLVGQFGAGRDFHPFMTLLHCHNNFKTKGKCDYSHTIMCSQ